MGFFGIIAILIILIFIFVYANKNVDGGSKHVTFIILSAFVILILFFIFSIFIWR